MLVELRLQEISLYGPNAKMAAGLIFVCLN